MTFKCRGKMDAVFFLDQVMLNAGAALVVAVREQKSGVNQDPVLLLLLLCLFSGTEMRENITA